jgi:hypothetical protein
MAESVTLSVSQAKRILERRLPELRRTYHVESLGIFGSYVRDEQNPESDLDILVTFSEPPGLIQFVALENHLSDLLGVQVDLVMKNALKPHLGERILQEVVPV